MRNCRIGGQDAKDDSEDFAVILCILTTDAAVPLCSDGSIRRFARELCKRVFERVCKRPCRVSQTGRVPKHWRAQPRAATKALASLARQGKDEEKEGSAMKSQRKGRHEQEQVLHM